MILRATHTTLYEYASPAAESHNEVRLMPIDNGDQRVVDFDISIDPYTPVFSYDRPGGVVHHFGIRPPHHHLQIVAESIVETFRANPFEELNLIDDDFDFYRSEQIHQRYIEFLSPSPYIRPNQRAAEIALSARANRPVSTAFYLLELSRLLHQSFAYDPDATHVHSTLDEVIDGGAGVCQDFSHLMIACARSQGIPARYVSGYLYVEKDEKGIRGEEATHAWVECLMPDGRWAGFDPTNNLLTGDHYIKVHIGRDYSDVTPTKGVYVGIPAAKLEVRVHVEKLAPAMVGQGK